MMTAAPTISQIKAQVAAIRRKVPRALAIGIHAAGRWAGQPEYRDGDETFRITQCDSPLALRIALRGQRDDASTTVVVTTLEDHDLDDDIRLRLAKRRLHTIDNWQIVKSLFQAHAIDPRVTRSSWMAEELLRLMPSEGYAPAGGGFLDADRVWSTLLRSHYGMSSGRPDLIALLLWAMDQSSASGWRAAPEYVGESAVQWITMTAGPLAPHILNLVATHDGTDAIAVALVLEVVYSAAASGKIERGIGKLEERFFSAGVPEAPLRNKWSDAAGEVVRTHVVDRRLRAEILERMDAILSEIGATEFAHLSDLSPTGFDQRLCSFASEIKDFLDRKPTASLERISVARESAVAHDQSVAEPRRVARSGMALRLLRWMQECSKDEPAWHSLTEAAQHHETTGSFVDWARLALRAGDQLRELSEAYSSLFTSVTSIREKHSHRFACLLRDWTASGNPLDDVVPVEMVLDTVVSRVAKDQPVLVVILDGLSFAVWRELQADLALHNWSVLVPEDGSVPVIGLATVPSVTEASRTTLLCGKLQIGDSSDERRGFESHTGLRASYKSGSAPRLFHKAALTEAGDIALAGDVRNAIASSDHRIVGVVINAIDDHLFKGEQIDVQWTREQIRVLPTLLHEATAAQRLVVVLSDHGHVLDHGTKGRRVPGDGGERWRADDGEQREGEMTLRGERILLSESKALVALTTEAVRYGSKRNGYHGGASPQEMLVPISILTGANSPPPGWQEISPQTPEWWDLDNAESEITRDHTAVLAPELLFPEMEEIPASEEVPGVASWITSLLSSTVFKDQKSLAGRTVPGDDEFTELLVALDARGGRMTAAALARSLSRSVYRLNGLLAVCQRVLNVDGYPVLSRDDSSDTIELKSSLAKSQFGIKG
jgi:PglZ domain